MGSPSKAARDCYEVLSNCTYPGDCILIDPETLLAERRRYKRRNRRRRAEGGDRKTKSDWPALSLKGRSASMLPYDHPAVMDGRTIYPKLVQAITDDTSVLKPGSNQWKLGGEMLKGDWRGFPVYALTLEERATCPKTCQHWRSCYGNRMHRAHRLEWEVARRADDHPLGFAVRLHVLGDFYSVEYVELWRRLLERHPALHISIPRAGMSKTIRSPVRWSRSHSSTRTVSQCAFRMRRPRSQSRPRSPVSILFRCRMMRPYALKKSIRQKAVRRAHSAGTARSASPSFSIDKPATAEALLAACKIPEVEIIIWDSAPPPPPSALGEPSSEGF